MQIKIFTIPLSDDGSAQAELNRFMQSHKVLEVKQQFFQNENGAAWCFCVNYLLSGGAIHPLQTAKKDYKELLSDKQFEVFSKLRSIRKDLAAADAVPAYAVFTDAELAEMAKLEELTGQNVKKISGIAEKRMEKYGKTMVEHYHKAQTE